MRAVRNNYNIRLNVHRHIVIQSVNALDNAFSHDQAGRLIVLHEIGALFDCRTPDPVIRESTCGNHGRFCLHIHIVFISVDKAEFRYTARLIFHHVIESAHFLQHGIKGRDVYAAADLIARPGLLIDEQNVNAKFC